MGNPRHIALALIASLLLVAAFGAWVAYQKGDVVIGGQRVEEHQFPLPLTNESNETMNEAQTTNPTVTLKTNHGDITLELYTDLMPTTAGNFLELAEKDFYDNTKFHRVIDGFMVQGGDPNSKTDRTETYGTGGPGYAIQDEHVADAKLSNTRGTISMANSGPNSGGSQFFINLVDNTGLDFDKQPLSSKHPVFGRVVSGMDVIDAIAKVPTDPRDVPLEPVVVQDVVVTR